MTVRGLVVAALLTASCQRTFWLEDVKSPVDSPDAGPTWQAWISTIELPRCPAGNTLVVNTTADELDGMTLAEAGEKLSFPEAVWIAMQRTGPDTILFDPAVFPPTQSVTLMLGTHELPLLKDLCIDGRENAVVMRWSQDAPAQTQFHLSTGAMAVGLTLLDLPMTLSIMNGASLAGCRIGTDGHTSVPPREGGYNAKLVGQSKFGPANSIGESALLVVGLGGFVSDSFFGLDPQTRVDLGVSFAVTFAATANSATIDQCVLAAHGHPVSLGPAGETSAFTLSRNFIGVDEKGQRLEGTWPGLELGPATSTFRIVANVIEGTDVAIRVRQGAAVRITQNRITGNGQGITFEGPVPVPPPGVDVASEAELRGTCQPNAYLEFFSDTGDQGQSLLGVSTCSPLNQTWSATGFFPTGLNFTATQTVNGRTSAFSAPRVIAP